MIYEISEHIPDLFHDADNALVFTLEQVRLVFEGSEIPLIWALNM